MDGLTLNITLPRLSIEELGWLIHYCGAKAETSPHFAEWVCTVATDEVARRMNPGSEAGSIPLPGDLVGAKGACFLMGAHCLARMPLSEGLASFADDLERKILCDIAGYLEAREFASA